MVKIIALPDLPDGGDIVDWIDAHGDAAEPDAMRAEIGALAQVVEPWRSVDADDLAYRPFPLDALPQPIRGFVDAGARAIVESGILQRLKVLDIAYGNMADTGARQLADAPGIRNLELLDVSRNALSSKGISALRKTGVNVVADRQHLHDERDYLYEVDAE